MVTRNWYRPTVVALFVLFVIANVAYLHRVPGLLGDEASEGENVFLLLDAGQLTVTGERSYIGPLIDYARVPLVLLLGYSVVPLRLLVLFFSLLTFWLVVAVFRRLWGPDVGLIGAVALLFSPVYLLYQRLGWAITLSPFLAFLILFLLTLSAESRLRRQAPLLAGLVAGLGLHNHVLFLPTLLGVVTAWLVAMVLGRRWGVILSYWPALVGFSAGFGTQLAVMMLNRDDFRDAVKATQLYAERLRDLPELLPMVVSGSSYVARYTGLEFAPPVFTQLTWLLAGLATVPLLLPGRRFVSWIWLLGLTVLLAALVYMTFQFSLRYFVTLVLGVWALAGVGLGLIIARLFKKRWAAWATPTAVSLALGLLTWTTFSTLLPYLSSGGSTGEFSIGNRNDSAAALVAIEPLLKCLRDAGPVYSKNVHIQNRLRYLSYAPDSGLDVVLEHESRKRAAWVVSYRLKGELTDTEVERCPKLTHWRVVGA